MSRPPRFLDWFAGWTSPARNSGRAPSSAARPTAPPAAPLAAERAAAPRPNLTSMSVPRPYAATFDELDDLTLLACALFGEARNQPREGKVAVAWVIRNRTMRPMRFGRGYRGVILRPWQFSAFNANDPNRDKMLHPLRYEGTAVWAACYEAAAAVFFGWAPDPTGGADHYHVTNMRPLPTWRDEGAITATLGHHTFYRLG